MTFFITLETRILSISKTNKEESSGSAICYLTEVNWDLLCFLSDKRSDEPRDMAVLDSLESFLDDLIKNEVRHGTGYS